MKSEEVLTDKIYECKSKLLKSIFTGKIKTKLENSCIVEIIDYEDIDQEEIKELQQKIVVSYKDIKKIKSNKEIA